MPDTKRLPLPADLREKALTCMRKDFSDFFSAMLTPQDRWPAVPHEDFVIALADSLAAVGIQHKLGKALLQTFIHELQDRCDNA